MPKPWEPGAVVLCDVRRDGSTWVRNEDLNKCLDRIAELEAALQQTLWQIEHDPPLLPQAKAIAQGALKGKGAE